MTNRFTKKPVTIEAIQWTGENLREVITFTDGPPDTRTTHAGMAWEAYTDLVARDGLKIYTLEGKMLANHGDWIIRGVKGEYYPCKPDIFEATYSPAALATWQATAAQAVVPPNAITASVMRDDGGEAPAFCLMAAYRSEKDAMDAFALITAAAQPSQADLEAENERLREGSRKW